MVLRTCNHVAWKATIGGSDIVGRSEQHSENPQTTPQGFLLMMWSVTTGHTIETVYVLGERFYHEGTTKTQSPEPLGEKAVGTQHCPRGLFLEIELCHVTDSKKPRVMYVSS